MKKVGAIYNDNECEFIVWSPFARSVDLYLCSKERKIPMSRDSVDYWKAAVQDLKPGERYYYLLNGERRADPASNYQPDGIFGPSVIINHSDFEWEDTGFVPVDLQDYIIYEIHTGTFTKEGTFFSVTDKLDYLADLGITAVEIMPVSQFPGERNWGYDGVFPFAPQNSYGGPDGLKTLIN